MIAFIDESGDHNLDPHKLDKNFDIFTLGSVCFKEEEYKLFDEKFKQMKKDLFGTEDFILHTAEITRPSNSKEQLNLKFNDSNFRKIFYSEVIGLIETFNFHIIACCILKQDHVSRYGEKAKDPYLFCFDNILNRMLFRSKNYGCKIYPEKRSHIEDIKLELSLLRIKTSGTSFFTGSEVSNLIHDFQMLNKSENNSGLQLADLIVTPISRHILGKNPKPSGNEIPFSVINEKIPSHCLTIYPKK